jgi:hypothetical protein
VELFQCHRGVYKVPRRVFLFVKRFIGNALDVSLGVWHFATKGIVCYERARDQGTLGSVAGYRHNKTPGRIYGFTMGKE